MQTMYEKMETAELDAAIAQLEAEVAEVKAKGLALDMARGPLRSTSPARCLTS